MYMNINVYLRAGSTQERTFRSCAWCFEGLPRTTYKTLHMHLLLTDLHGYVAQNKQTSRPSVRKGMRRALLQLGTCANPLTCSTHIRTGTRALKTTANTNKGTRGGNVQIYNYIHIHMLMYVYILWAFLNEPYVWNDRWQTNMGMKHVSLKL